MNVVKKIFSVIFNPLTYLFKIDSHLEPESIDKKHIIVGILSILATVAVMIICYMFIF